jgi:signal transduction histidine kinase
MGGRPLQRAAGAVAAFVSIVSLVPLAARSESHPVVTTLIVASIAAAGAAACLVGRWWTWSCALLAAASLTAEAAASVRDPSAARLALGHAAVVMIAPLLGALVLGRRRLAGWALLAAALAGPVRELIHDPFLDPGCTVRCGRSPFALVHLQGIAEILQVAGTLFTALFLVWASIVQSKARWAIVLASLEAWFVVIRPGSGSWVWSNAAAVAALIVVTVDSTRYLIEDIRMSRRIAALSNSDDLEATLRREVGDDRILVSYAVDGDELVQPGAEAGSNEAQLSLVDGSGTIRDPFAEGLVATDVRATGRLVARIHHQEHLDEVRSLVAALNGQSLFTFGMCRLRALTAFQSARVRNARLRIVSRTDEERRMLERDVHDGTQQQVLALGMELELAMLDLADDAPERAVLLTCSSLVRSVLDQLRDVTHGLRPGGLDGAGLDAALYALCGRAAVPVTIEGLPSRSVPEAVETIVVALLRSVVSVATAPVVLRCSDRTEWLSVEVDGVDPELLDPLIHDRAAAIGGTLHPHGRGVHLEIPCER